MPLVAKGTTRKVCWLEFPSEYGNSFFKKNHTYLELKVQVRLSYNPQDKVEECPVYMR